MIFGGHFLASHTELLCWGEDVWPQVNGVPEVFSFSQLATAGRQEKKSSKYYVRTTKLAAQRTASHRAPRE